VERKLVTYVFENNPILYGSLSDSKLICKVAFELLNIILIRITVEILIPAYFKIRRFHANFSVSIA